MVQADGVADLVNLHHHPWGNSYFPTAACGGGPYDSDTRHCWAKTCVETASPKADCFVGKPVVQHGPEEYEMNRMHACAKTLTMGEGWKPRYWPFVVCTEALWNDGIKAAEGCVAKIGLNASAFDACFSGSSGDAALVREAKATPDHAGTPTLSVNGKEVEAEALLAAVCDAIADTHKPAACQKMAVSSNQGDAPHERHESNAHLNISA